jgi:hypothetical protein
MDDITPRLVRKKPAPRQLTGKVIRRSMDTIQVVPRRPVHVPPMRTSVPAPLRPSRLGLTRQPLNRALDRISWLQYPLIGIVALAMAYSTTIGQWLVAAYAVAVLLLRIDSRQPFIIALILLVAVPVFQVIGLPVFSQNVAIYAYETLVIGVIVAIIETSKNPSLLSEERGL